MPDARIPLPPPFIARLARLTHGHAAMISDLDHLDGPSTSAEVCIVGAGAAGIAIARELDGCDARVVVLESGRRSFDDRTQALYDADVVGVPHGGVHGYRYRVFGGSTTKWAGQALPLSAIDLERRDWVPSSGWPITLEDLEPYYRRASSLMEIAPFPAERSGAWPTALASAPPFDPSLVKARFSQFSPRPNFSEVHGPTLEASSNVTVVLGANVTELVPDESLGGIDYVVAQSFSGTRVNVHASHFVLCAGGLEVPRILLASDARCDGGIGNGHDLVGRFFQDHPGIEVGEFSSADRRLRRAFRPRRRGAVKYAPLFSAAEKLQRAERLANASGTVTFGRRAASDIAAKTLLQALGRSEFSAQARAEAPAAARALLRDPAPVLRAAGRRYLLRQPGFDTSGVPTLVAGGEQVPNRESRVYLGDARDELGVRRLVLDWRVAEQDLRSWRRFAEIVAAEFERLGWGSVELDESVLPDDPSKVTRLVDAGHHMGTTRMADDPRHGVVDAECRVHGFENLFVASSSVFPTGGFSNPTYTILALALRLADRLRSLVGREVRVDAA